MTYTPPPINHNAPVDPAHRYACKDRPKPGKPWLKLKESNSCGHSYKETDPCCQGCKWRDGGP